MNRDPRKNPLWKRFFLHLHTVDTHRYEVMKNCFKCGLYSQGLSHDLSKYSPEEFRVSVKYFQGDRSPYVYEKEKYGFSYGWLHHKGRNRHHWEYWYDMIKGEWVPLEMPLPFFIEMVCDRVAACHIYQKENYTQRSALEYFYNRNDRFYMHEKTAAKLEAVLKDIAENGEDAAFARLKKELQEYRRKNGKEGKL
ncbi:MAG: catalase [Solobacterium sp.]|nr:catalase [Solobacterium sp.]